MAPLIAIAPLMAIALFIAIVAVSYLIDTAVAWAAHSLGIHPREAFTRID